MRLAERKARGFTLIEMAIVLVIIGIILAGVMKGRDIVRGAQIKQFSQQFAQKWVTIAQTYYDKTGNFLNDGAINAGIANTNPDGRMDANVDARAAGVVTRLRNTGIAVCTLVKSKLTTGLNGGTGTTPAEHCGTGVYTAGAANQVNVIQTLVDGEYAANQRVTIDLVGIVLDQADQEYSRNILVLYNVPVDVAVGLDTLIDGTANGLLGSCVGLGGTYNAADAGVTPTIGGAGVIAQGDTITATQWGNAVQGAANNARCQTVGIIFDY